MSESRDHKCPRCGGYLPTVTVRVPVYANMSHMNIPAGAWPTPIVSRYEEREEVAECVRCTGGY